MRVVVTGGTGFVGRDVVDALLARDEDVTVVTRDASRMPQSIQGRVATCTWNELDLDGVDAVVHLAGENLFARRWSKAQKQRILSSRVDSSEKLLEAIQRAAQRPRVLVHASAIGYYGPKVGAEQDDEVDETSPPGSDFLAEVCVAWEAACSPACDLGLRVVPLRLGIVLGEGGGALQEMKTPFLFFIGGPIGDGKQWMSWVHLRDVSRLALLAIDDERCTGPLNVVAPHPVRMNTFAKALGRAMMRPSWLRVPRFAIRLFVGEAASTIVEGQRVVPLRARELGYGFEYAEVAEALTDILRSDSDA
ncbi:MAG: TIGR01777 family oxidoreductase [Planctomycetes bacterium]|nr:TIGR01777 family oxidoreductase [Planctomycetota bacterium]